jgi:Thioredoxin
MMRRATFPLIAVLTLASAAACSADSKSSADARPTISVIDSIRVRREAAAATRPDTFGNRVDSLRILRGSDRRVPWVVVVSEFQCPACARFSLEVLPAIRRDIAERGNAQLAFINTPNIDHFNSRFASHAALCAASANRFWDMHDSLFASLPRWDRIPDPQPFMDSLAIAAGVPPDVQHTCTSKQRLLRLLDGDVRRSRTAGVKTPPVVFVDEERLEGAALTVETLRETIARKASER